MVRNKRQHGIRVAGDAMNIILCKHIFNSFCITTIGKDVAAACLFSSQASVQVSLDAIQVMGGRGYRNDESPGRLLRDAKIYEIGGGTNEIRRIVIARDLLSAAAKK